MGTQLPSPKGRSRPPPIFGPYLLRPNDCMQQDVTWYGARPRRRRLCVRWGPRSPPKGGHRYHPIFGPCPLWPMAGWIKMPLGMEVGLGPGHIVLEGTQLPLPKKETEPPIFGPFLLWPNGCMYQDITWYGGRPQPRRHCVRWGLSSPLLKG